MVIVCSGINVETYNNRSVFAWMREEYNRGVAVGGLCTGAYVLAAAGLLSNKRCAIHWENLPGFSEAFPKANVFADLFEVDQNIYTCAGGTAALDMMLKLIGDDFDENLVNRVCEQVLTDRVRSPTDRQRLPLRARLGVQNSKVLTIIELMEANLSEPLSLIEIADNVGLSRRQIERLFRQEMGRSPARYYLEIRLDRARHLLIQSSMPVVEVAVACGFVSASHFSKCYRELYARSPQQERVDSKQLHGGVSCLFPSPRSRGEGQTASPHVPHPAAVAPHLLALLAVVVRVGGDLDDSGAFHLDGAAAASSSTSLRLTASGNCDQSLTGIMKAAGPPITQLV